MDPSRVSKRRVEEGGSPDWIRKLDQLQETDGHRCRDAGTANVQTRTTRKTVGERTTSVGEESLGSSGPSQRESKESRKERMGEKGRN